MAFSICTVSKGSKHDDQWMYVLSHWRPDTWYVIHDSSYTPSIQDQNQNIVYISSADQLPTEPELVLLSPLVAHNYPGETNLETFTHPDNAIYMFGWDHEHLYPPDDPEGSELGSRVPDHKVYIPNEMHFDMYSFVSCAVTLYDRKVKSNG